MSDILKLEAEISGKKYFKVIDLDEEKEHFEKSRLSMPGLFEREGKTFEKRITELLQTSVRGLLFTVNKEGVENAGRAEAR